MKTASSISVVTLAVAVLLGGCSDGELHLPAPTSGFERSVEVLIDDFDGDGALDIALLSITISSPPFDSRVTVALQGAQGAWRAAGVLSVGTDAESLAAGDLNGDQLVDIVTANRSSYDLSIAFADSTSPGAFQPEVVVPVPVPPSDVGIGDFDGDGLADLVACSGIMSEVVLVLQDPQAPGSFASPFVLQLGVSSTSLAVVDVDGDTLLDLVLTTSAGVAVVRQSGGAPLSFLPPVFFSVRSHPTHVVAGDLNGDTFPDLAVAHSGSGFVGPGGVWVLFQDPGVPGSFLREMSVATLSGPVFVAIGDIDGDALPDLAVANALGPGTASVILQDPTQAGQFLPATNLASAGLPRSVAIGDVDGDGTPDIIVADDGARAFFQDPVSGAFSPPQLLLNN